MAVKTVPANASCSGIYPEEVYAAILLTTSGKISTLSQKIYEMKAAGYDLEANGIALSRAPDGFYSESLAEYVSLLWTFGYIPHLSPISLTEKGMALCKDIVGRAFKRNPTAVDGLVGALKLDASKLKGNSPA